jgi:hypothetical protein
MGNRRANYGVHEMKFILIVVFLHSYGPRHFVQFQEFDSKEQCRAAGATIGKMDRLSNYQFACVAKGKK